MLFCRHKSKEFIHWKVLEGSKTMIEFYSKIYEPPRDQHKEPYTDQDTPYQIFNINQISHLAAD